MTKEDAASVNGLMVSVVVTAYNQEDTIAQALDSILEQKCNFPFEILIGDDRSTDKTREVCQQYYNKYPQIIRLIFYEKNAGVAANWVKTIQQARGKYITACAGDDYWNNPAKLQMQVDYLEERPDYGLLYTDYDVLNAVTGKITKNSLTSRGVTCPEGSGLIKTIFTGKLPVLVFTVCFRKSLFDQHVRGEDYIKFHFPIEDWPTWLILSKYCSIGYLPVSTGTYRRGIESNSNPLQYEKIEKKYNAEHIMYKYLCDRFPDDLVYDEKGYLNYINTILLNLAYKKNDFNAAKIYAQKIIDNGYKRNNVTMAKHRLTFYLFSFLKRLKKNLVKEV